MTEAAFQRQVEDRLDELGWKWLHIPRSQTGKRFRTMTTGPLGKGWPDLLVCRGYRIFVIELKTDKGSLSPDQEKVLDILNEAIPVEVIRPKDWDRLEQVLR